MQWKADIKAGKKKKKEMQKKKKKKKKRGLKRSKINFFFQINQSTLAIRKKKRIERK